MKNLTVIFFLILAMSTKAQSACEIMARYVAEDYYTGLHRIAEMSSCGELAYWEQVRRLELQLYDLFGKDNKVSFATEVRVSNDIDQIFGSIAKYTDISASNYIGRFTKYAIQNKFDFTYDVVSCEQMETPSVQSARDDARFVKVVVNKKIRKDRKTTKVKDTMIVTFVEGDAYIYSIRNSYDINPLPEQ